MQTTRKTETAQVPGMRIHSLPRWVPGRQRFVVWGHGLPRVLTVPATLALMEGMTLEELRVAGDPESVALPDLLRVNRVLKGETLPALFGERVTIHPISLEDRQIQWVSSAHDQHAHRQVSLWLTFSVPPEPSFVDLVTLTLQMAVNGSLSTEEEQRQMLTLMRTAPLP
ncbi:MAG: hypothetical protein C7B46_20650 [Sulfobacillus benefaciens]|uniref:Uncharacterized protein n=1 Tax=Sulfobacillus benefaciens TaxID=453960 RepID=A0A2T2WT21_9FIRM|nr:MAG: hypothetical protein C7B46_20650 [Sulfobacillus benefaciens]